MKAGDSFGGVFVRAKVLAPSRLLEIELTKCETEEVKKRR